MQIEEPPRALPVQSFALFALGFRPFYLLASAFAALSVPLWALQFAGWLGQPYLAGPLWHAHEMLFGFTLAVIVGFLFTAGSNWSGRPTLQGAPLAGLALLWVVARVLVLTPYATAAAVANVAFPAASAVALAIPFVRAGNRRNYFFVGLLAVMALAALCFHLAHLGHLQGLEDLEDLEDLGFTAAPAWRSIRVALDVVLFMLVVMGGRVIPMFTNNGIAGAQARKLPALEKTALASILALLCADAAGLHGWPVAAIAAVGCAAHAWRLALWQPWKTLRTPLVWVLHIAYLWIPVHLLLRGLSETGQAAATLATHALTTGAVGGLVIGMITRTAKGHTGRQLRADGFDAACYVLILLAAAVRVLLPLAAPAQALHATLVSAVLWSLGFGLYAVRYWPVLSRSRLDGRPG
ncbi:MAG: NnrS family protein [Comamonadaceae bacterium]|nr:MAG: NnrS family protein [Comamonadaceae bacterium]